MNLLKAPRSLTFSLLAGALALLSQGCGGATQSAQQALDRQYKDNPQLQRPNLAKFSGTVTVDGQPLPYGRVMFAPRASEANVQPGKPAIGVIQSDGRYTLSTYGDDDGAVVGSHTVTVFGTPPAVAEGASSSAPVVDVTKTVLVTAAVIVTGPNSLIWLRVTCTVSKGARSNDKMVSTPNIGSLKVWLVKVISPVFCNVKQ